MLDTEKVTIWNLMCQLRQKNLFKQSLNMIKGIILAGKIVVVGGVILKLLINAVWKKREIARGIWKWSL